MSKGLSGLLTKAVLGPHPESRRSYIEALASSDLVTLEEIDRILHTHYARLPDDTRGVGWKPKPHGGLSSILMPPRADTRIDRFFSLDSLIQHVLHSYVTKSDLQKLCQQLGLPGTGNKGDLEARTVGDPGLTSSMALYYVDRDNMKKLCEDLKLPTTGTRREMESRVLNVIARLPRTPPSAPSYEPPRYAPPTVRTPTVTPYAAPPQQTPVAVPPPPSQSPTPDAETPSSQNVERESMPLETPKTSIPPPPRQPMAEQPPMPSIPARPELESVVEFIDKWRPTKPYKDEEKYQIELFTKLCGKFGDEHVMQELNVLDGRIDIEVMGIGVELKVPNKAQLQRLVGQSIMYRKHYGPNLIAVIFADKTRLQDVIAFKNDLERLGIRVSVK